MQMRTEGGVTIALKIPKAHYPATLAFYREALGLDLRHEDSAEVAESWSCQFGATRLWLDRVDGASQAEAWLEMQTGGPGTPIVRID